MKKILAILAILLTFGTIASAQISSPVSFYAGGAMSFPSAPDSFKDSFKNGYHGFVGLGYHLNPFLEFIAKAEYHTFQFDFDAVNSEYSGGTNKMWMFGGDLKLNPSFPALPIKPYILGGAGVANLQQTEFEGPTSLTLSLLNHTIAQDQTKFYWNVGGGASLFNGPKFSIFAQARYVSIATDNETSSFIPVTIGFKFF
jgi:hypothetical protein